VQAIKSYAQMQGKSPCVWIGKSKSTRLYSDMVLSNLFGTCISLSMLPWACFQNRFLVSLRKPHCIVWEAVSKRRMNGAGQNRVYTPYMTVYLVISLPKITYIHYIYGSGILANHNVWILYAVLANPTCSLDPLHSLGVTGLHRSSHEKI